MEELQIDLDNSLPHPITMTHQIDKIYEDALESGLIPGASVIAGDANGNPQPRKEPPSKESP